MRNKNLILNESNVLEKGDFNIRDLNLDVQSLLHKFYPDVNYDSESLIGSKGDTRYIIDLIQDTNNHGEEENKRVQSSTIKRALNNNMDIVALYPIVNNNFEVISILFVQWNSDVFINLDYKKNAGLKVKLHEIMLAFNTKESIIAKDLMYESVISSELV